MAGRTHRSLVAILVIFHLVRDSNGGKTFSLGNGGYLYDRETSCENPRLLADHEIVCTASSEHSPPWSCEKAFDKTATEDWENEEGNTWATKGKGVGAWIKAYFKKPHQVKKIQLIQRANEDERNREVELEFSEGETKKWVLEKGRQSTQIQSSLTLGSAILTRSLKVTITEVFNTINNGWEEVKIYVCD